jgi:hypothetical protein
MCGLKLSACLAFLTARKHLDQIMEEVQPPGPPVIATMQVLEPAIVDDLLVGPADRGAQQGR